MLSGVAATAAYSWRYTYTSKTDNTPFSKTFSQAQLQSLAFKQEAHKLSATQTMLQAVSLLMMTTPVLPGPTKHVDWLCTCSEQGCSTAHQPQQCVVLSSPPSITCHNNQLAGAMQVTWSLIARQPRPFDSMLSMHCTARNVKNTTATLRHLALQPMTSNHACDSTSSTVPSAEACLQAHHSSPCSDWQCNHWTTSQAPDTSMRHSYSQRVSRFSKRAGGL
jgi:hypothetical protein